ncbi:DMT family transporter [Moritella viscosa]|uniref:Membrane protein, putative n=1 Tax=Moritella viscosa TaxID=80854 RepID=A0A1L0EC23_9GAMM|nr:EamA family transporter [Moritella viscosa]SGZ01905.1 Membrane protein, putative [Moritella viscosa]SHO06933.1 Membrane protein, putative [Moritella viscosa]SHO07044.1 Membrane protein, putative [Moritella viscosa]SHO10838.1 Membrane protein, putative [Moritella viscosa]SHO15054.1 Membrane protein, putative [Moritella viscosa]
MSALLYVSMIFIWGFSWISIKWQHGDVPMEVSIFYRFAIAATVMFVVGKIWGKLQPVKRKDHAFLALQGVCLFCCNFIAFYSATLYIPSGLVAVFMASAPVFNAFHSKLFYKTQTNANFWLGAILGLAGISLLFAGDLLQTDWSQGTLYGLLFALLGTWCFSIGNMLSIRNTKNNVQPFTATSYAMVYGCVALLLIILVRGISFEFTITTQYIGSLLYLAIPASVLGFTFYLILVDRLGASNAAYILVITPVVALSVSAVFEDYYWTLYSTLGLVLVILGNVLTQRKKALLTRTKVQSLIMYR